MTELTGNQTLNGTYGKLWWDGEEILEIMSFEVKVKAGREDITFNGSLDKDSKIKELSGEGKIKVRHVYSRGMKKMLEAWNKGKDVRSKLVGALNDPNAVDGQKERISISNCWFTELTLADWEQGKIGEKEFPFGFTPSSAKVLEEIK